VLGELFYRYIGYYRLAVRYHVDDINRSKDGIVNQTRVDMNIIALTVKPREKIGMIDTIQPVTAIRRIREIRKHHQCVTFLNPSVGSMLSYGHAESLTIPICQVYEELTALVDDSICFNRPEITQVVSNPLILNHAHLFYLVCLLGRKAVPYLRRFRFGLLSHHSGAFERSTGSEALAELL